MSHKNKKNSNTIPGKAAKAFPEGIIDAREGGITKKDSYIPGSAVIIIITGYISLSKAAPDGRDIWSTLAAVLLAAGYLMIPLGIMARRTAPIRTPMGFPQKRPFHSL